MSTATLTPASAPSVRTVRSDTGVLLDHVGRLLRDRHDRGVAVARWHRGHHARGRHPETRHAAYPRPGGADSQLVDPQPAGAGLVVVAVGLGADELGERGRALDVRTGHQLTG